MRKKINDHHKNQYKEAKKMKQEYRILFCVRVPFVPRSLQPFFTLTLSMTKSVNSISQATSTVKPKRKKRKTSTIKTTVIDLNASNTW